MSADEPSASEPYRQPRKRSSSTSQVESQTRTEALAYLFDIARQKSATLIGDSRPTPLETIPSESPVNNADPGGPPLQRAYSDYGKDSSSQNGNLRQAKREYRKHKRTLIAQTSVGSAQIRALKDMNVLMEGDLKMRDVLKNWHVRRSVLVPGMLHYYRVRRRDKSLQWVGSIILAGCHVLKRPSKKDGFCFKIIHPDGIVTYEMPSKSIYDTRHMVDSLPINANYAILRHTDPAEGQKWYDALRQMVGDDGQNEQDNDEGHDDSDEEQSSVSDDDVQYSDDDDTGGDKSVYIKTEEATSLDQGQSSGEMGEENKNLLLALLKQVKPGMDLSRVTLPTFILEPRSFLEKLADYYFHADLLSKAARTPQPVQRMIEVVRWYLSGFYKKPKGVKKPYNPILGEMYRCYWKHSDGGKTIYVAEQVSHHPPRSAFYATNRRHGWCINGSVTPKSKFMGNSAGTLLEGYGLLYFHNFNEVYRITLPNATVKGIILGGLTMELTGSVVITNESNGLVANLEFKQKPMMKGQYNGLSGTISHQSDVLYRIEGLWDERLDITNARTKVTEPLWVVDENTLQKRLPHYSVDPEFQSPNDSQRLWTKVSDAIVANDQSRATEEKYVLESEQRREAKLRQEQNIEYKPRLFREQQDDHYFIYRAKNTMPWDANVDEYEFELNGTVYTKQKDGQSVDGQDGPATIAVTLAAKDLMNIRDSTRDAVKGFSGRGDSLKKVHVVEPTTMHADTRSDDYIENLQSQLDDLRRKVLTLEADAAVLRRYIIYAAIGMLGLAACMGWLWITADKAMDHALTTPLFRDTHGDGNTEL